jgi:hypothetical protein
MIDLVGEKRGFRLLERRNDGRERKTDKGRAKGSAKYDHCSCRLDKRLKVNALKGGASENGPEGHG